MDIQVSYFSLASLIALALFLVVIIPQSLWHLVRGVGRAFGRKELSFDPWLFAIGLITLVCIALVAAVSIYSDRTQRLLNASAALTFAFLFFALPAVLQVLRAWSSQHGHKAQVLSHPLVLLAILSLPASMAIPTAALMRTTQAAQASAAPADSPAAALVDDRFFTDSEIVNDPADYPIARFLQQYASWRPPAASGPPTRRPSFYREVPMFTAFWFDQTTNMLTFDATDTFGVLISPISHVRANLAFSLAVWVYKLLCGLILVAVTFDTLLRPIGERVRGRWAAKA